MKRTIIINNKDVDFEKFMKEFYDKKLFEVFEFQKNSKGEYDYTVDSKYFTDLEEAKEAKEYLYNILCEADKKHVDYDLNDDVNNNDLKDYLEY